MKELGNNQILKWNFNINGHSHTKYVIYQIKNTISQKYYVGQTRRELNKRWNDYKTDLLKPIQKERKVGTNLKLKRSVQKYYKQTGNVDFLEFSIIEVVDVSGLLTDEEKRDKLDERETFYIKNYKKEYGKNNVFNIIENVYSYIFTEETRNKISLIKIGKKQTKETIEKRRIANTGKKRTEETKKLLSKQKVGEKNPMFGASPWNKGKTEVYSEETKRKMGLANIGKIPHNKGKNFSLETRIKMSKSARGKIPWNKGIEMKEITGMNHPRAKVYDLSLNPLVSPTGEEVIKIECLSEFCRKHELSSGTFCMLLNKQRKSYKGWRLKSQ